MNLLKKHLFLAFLATVAIFPSMHSSQASSHSASSTSSAQSQTSVITQSEPKTIRLHNKPRSCFSSLRTWLTSWFTTAEINLPQQQAQKTSAPAQASSSSSSSNASSQTNSSAITAEELFQFGLIYWNGTGVTKDQNLALGYFERAAAKGNTAALKILEASRKKQTSQENSHGASSSLSASSTSSASSVITKAISSEQDISSGKKQFRGVCKATLLGHRSEIFHLAALPNNTIASMSHDKITIIWDMNSKKFLRIADKIEAMFIAIPVLIRGLSSPLSHKATLPNDKIALSSPIWDRTTIRICNATDERCLHTLSGHTGWINDFAVLLDGTLASGSLDATIKIWNPESGECLRTLKGHTGSIEALAALPDGTLASGSMDHTIKIWDPRTGRCLRTLTGHNGAITYLLVLPNGGLASGSSDRTVKIWE